MIVVAREPWTIENGCLTPTMKIKRSRIEDGCGAADRGLVRRQQQGGLGMSGPDARQALHALRHGGDRVAAVLQAHGVRTLFTLCGGHISPILSAAKARGIRVVDVRDEVTAVFAADATARLTGRPGVAAVTAGPGHHQHHHRAEERAAGAVAGAADRRRRAHRAAGPRRAAGHRPAAAGGAAREALLQACKRVRDLGPAVAEALALAAIGRARAGVRRVPGGPALRRGLDPPVVCRRRRQGHGHRRPRAALVPEPPRAAHVRRQRRTRTVGRSAQAWRTPRAADSRAAAARARAAEARAAADRDRQPGGGALRPRPTRWPRPCRALGVPVYLSGMARGLLGPRPPAADAPPAPQGAARGRLRAARRRALRLPPRLRQARAPQRHADRRQPQRQGRAAEPPPRHRGASATPGSSSRRWPGPCPKPAARWAGWMRRRCAGATPSARPRSTRRPRLRASTSTRWPSSARWRPRPATTPSSSPTAATSSPPPATSCTRAGRSPGSTRAPSARWAWAPASPSARRWPGPDSEVWIVWGDGACGYGLAEFDTFVRHGIPVIAVVGNDAGWTQIAREQVKMLHDDVGTVLARTAYHEVAEGFGAEGHAGAAAPTEVQPALAAGTANWRARASRCW